MVRITTKYILFILLSLSYTSYAQGQTTPARTPNYIEGEVIVKMRGARPGVQSNSFAAKAAQKGMSLKTSWGRMGMYHYKVARGQTTQAAIAELRQDPEVEYAEPNYILTKANVTGFSDIISEGEMNALNTSNGYLATGAPIQVVDSWSEVQGSNVPVVAIIDTGLDTSHSVIQNTQALWRNTNEIPGNGIDDDGNGYIDDVNGWNFVANSNNVFDDNGHGTHVAGIILGVGTNIYVSSPQPAKVKVMPLKFLNGSGQGSTSAAIKAIYYAVDNGAQVLNNSWGGYSYSAALHEAITYSYNHGTAFVAAAGNDAGNNDSTPMYPAGYDVPNVIAVAATTDSDVLASFSNYGRSTVDLASPGVRIYSTYPGNSFGISSGTSMATPFVSGLAGLILVEKPTMMGFQIRDLIMTNTDAVANLSAKVATQGRMNALDTVHAAQVATVETTLPAYNPSNQDRNLASAIASGGCGTVSTLMSRGGGNWPNAPGADSWGLYIIIGLFMAPIAIHMYLRSKSPESRRKHERFKIDTEVKVQVGDRQLTASISTISLGGVQLDTNALLEQGGIVKMSIQSPDGKEQIEVDGRVVWSEANRSYGVAFQEAKDTALEKIGGWTSSLTKT